ncbi:MAG: DUF1573 domain-containing protein [Cyclobacteriaceae bacterium]
MKYALTILTLFFALTTIYAQGPDADAETVTGPKISFAKSKYDFGEVNQGEKVQYDFLYVNTGSGHLVISDVKTTCGCTAPNWSREALAPGDTATLKVVFSSVGKRGMQNKVITVYSNAVNNPERVTLTGNVLLPSSNEQ